MLWFFLKNLITLFQGKKIFDFPKINYFYRVNTTSMVRTYPSYPAELRLARNILGIGTWDAQRLYACLNTPVYKIIETTTPSSIDDSFAGKGLLYVRGFLHNHPLIRKTGKAIVSFVWVIFKKLRSNK